MPPLRLCEPDGHCTAVPAMLLSRTAFMCSAGFQAQSTSNQSAEVGLIHRPMKLVQSQCA